MTEREPGTGPGSGEEPEGADDRPERTGPPTAGGFGEDDGAAGDGRDTGDGDDGTSRRTDAESGATGAAGAPGRAELPADEEAAWAEIVAAYGDVPKVPEGAESDRLTAPRPGADDEDGGAPVRSFTVYAAGTGPRGWAADTGGRDDDEDDEGHFEPPEPPPLPQADTTTKFAWIAVLGGPLLLILAIVLQLEMTWWITTLGVGGFLGGFGTLVARMRDGRDDDDWDDPGRGAVV